MNTLSCLYSWRDGAGAMSLQGSRLSAAQEGPAVTTPYWWRAKQIHVCWTGFEPYHHKIYRKTGIIYLEVLHNASAAPVSLHQMPSSFSACLRMDWERKKNRWEVPDYTQGPLEILLLATLTLIQTKDQIHKEWIAFTNSKGNCASFLHPRFAGVITPIKFCSWVQFVLHLWVEQFPVFQAALHISPHKLVHNENCRQDKKLKLCIFNEQRCAHTHTHTHTHTKSQTNLHVFCYYSYSIIYWNVRIQLWIWLQQVWNMLD